MRASNPGLHPVIDSTDDDLMRVERFAPRIWLVMLACWLVPAAADAQWHFAVYMGGNHTPPADIQVVDPTTDTNVTYSKVGFDAEPFKAPQYYGWRFGRGLTKERRLGVELEFTHLKVLARTDALISVTGHADGAVVNGLQRMSARVQRYSMSHGLNFILINLTSRMPLGWGGDGRTTLVLRGGAGPTLPHAETQVNGVSREQYEWAGLGGNGGAGVEIRLAPRLAATVDYKVTYAKPTITIAGGGTGQTTALSHHLAVGVVLRLQR